MDSKLIQLAQDTLQISSYAEITSEKVIQFDFRVVASLLAVTRFLFISRSQPEPEAATGIPREASLHLLDETGIPPNRIW
jgi:hypothetical protein